MQKPRTEPTITLPKRSAGQIFAVHKETTLNRNWLSIKMPHQRGDPPSSYSTRGAPNIVMDGREAHPMQHVLAGPRIMHQSPGPRHPMMHSRQAHPSMFRGPHPHSPASWGYSSLHGSPYHVAGGLSANSSGENLMEERAARQRGSMGADMARGAIKDKADVISEAEADAASALLFASSKVSIVEEAKGEDPTAGRNSQEEQRSARPERVVMHDGEEKKEDNFESNVPLKKRRKMLHLLSQRPDATSDAQTVSHVSPLPSPAGRSHIHGHDPSDETTATASPQRTCSTGMESSYDMKDAQSPQETRKVNDAKAVSTPPSQVIIEHFPTVLHNILNKSEFAGNVLQWVAGGKAWKIVRWDALRRKVLPAFFPKLQDEDGNSNCSIDAFLWQVTAWGFEEVQDGPDVGAYTHKLFCKDLPHLCHQMSFSPNSDLESPTALPKKNSNNVLEKVNSASQPHSILQVPSLASSTRSIDGDNSSKMGEKSAKWNEEADSQKGETRSPATSYPLAGRIMRHPENTFYMSRRMSDMTYGTEGIHFCPESPYTVRHVGTPGGLAYERRFMAQPALEHGRPRTISLHNSPRLQSGRGAMRISVGSRMGLSEFEQPQRKTSFPVSNRGKGNRISSMCRVLIPSCDNSKRGVTAKSTTDQQAESSELQRFSEKVAERVAVAVSKKTKRKLPLSSTAKGSDECSAEPQDLASSTEEEPTMSEANNSIEEKIVDQVAQV